MRFSDVMFVFFRCIQDVLLPLLHIQMLSKLGTSKKKKREIMIASIFSVT